MFLSFKASSGSDQDRSPWGDFWFNPVAAAGAGGPVTADSAMQLMAVYACVRVLVESFAVLPFRLYKPGQGGKGRTQVTDHWLYQRMCVSPNRFQDAFGWREMLQGHLALRGNAYNEIVDDGRGGIAQLLPRHPDRMRIEMLDGDDYRYRYTDRAGTRRTLRRDQVWHLRGLSADGLVGLNPIELQRKAIASGLAAQDYATRFFANDAKPTGGWIEFAGFFKSKADKQNFRESWQEVQGGANRGKVAVLENGMKYHEIGLTNKDSQFLESRQFTRSDIASMFRVPPHMIGDLSRATFSNIEQQSIEFWQNTMLPWTERWESSIESQLLGEGEGLEVEFDFRNLLRGDATSRAAYIHNLVLDGVLTRNEARELEGYNPIDGLDEPLVPANERELSEPAAADPAPTPSKPAAAPDDEEASARLHAVVQASAQRLARRAAGALAKKPAAEVFDADFAAVVAEALAITPARADEFCTWSLAYFATGLAPSAYEQHAALMLTTYGTMP